MIIRTDTNPSILMKVIFPLFTFLAATTTVTASAHYAGRKLTTSISTHYAQQVGAGAAHVHRNRNRIRFAVETTKAPKSKSSKVPKIRNHGRKVGTVKSRKGVPKGNRKSKAPKMRNRDLESGTKVGYATKVPKTNTKSLKSSKVPRGRNLKGKIKVGSTNSSKAPKNRQRHLKADTKVGSAKSSKAPKNRKLKASSVLKMKSSKFPKSRDLQSSKTNTEKSSKMPKKRNLGSKAHAASSSKSPKSSVL